MAIVRTTSNDPNAGGPAPPADTPASGNSGASTQKVDRTKSVVSQSKSAPRATTTRQMPGRSGVSAGQTQARPTDFFNDTIAELKRVVWPTRQDVRAGTLVTIGLLIAFGLYISALDVVTVRVFQFLGIYTITH